MTWWMASILANVCIAAVEYFNRTAGFATFGHALITTAPFIVAAQYGLFRAWDGAPSLMFAWAFFTLGNTLFRLVSVHWFVGGEHVGWQTLLGVSLIFGGAAVIKGAA